MHSLQAVKRAFFVDHWIPLVFLVSGVCDRLGQGRLESAASCSEESFVCFLRCSSGTVLHLHSRTCFWQDNCHCSNRKLASFGIILSNPYYTRLRCVFFSSVLIFVGEEKEEVWFDYSGHCSRSSISLARWAYSQPTAPVRTVCNSLLFNLRLFATLQQIFWPSTAFSGPPSRAVSRCAGVRRTAR